MESKSDQDEVEGQGYFFTCLIVKRGEWKKRRQQGLRWTQSTGVTPFPVTGRQKKADE